MQKSHRCLSISQIDTSVKRMTCDVHDEKDMYDAVPLSYVCMGVGGWCTEECMTG